MITVEEQTNEINKQSEEIGKIENTSQDLIDNLQENPLELETENYRIDVNLGYEEKLQNGRTKEKVSSNIGEINIWKKDLGDGAYVREYADYEKMSAGFGEQKFNWKAVNKLGLVDKLPKNYETVEKIRGNDPIGFRDKCFLKKNGNIVMTGYWFNELQRFDSVRAEEGFWLGDGTSANISSTKGNMKNGYFGKTDPRNGYAIRLPKS